MSSTVKAFAAFLFAGSAAMLFLNIYSLFTLEPLDLQLVRVAEKP